MTIANEHNLHRDPASPVCPFGIRAQLRRGDPLSLLLGKDWQKVHWYGTAEERDAALADMGRRHEYSRTGDEPAMAFQKVERLAESRGR
ncbi:MAG: hypothetical protein WCH32_09920 [Pseudomonadota bacterium]